MPSSSNAYQPTFIVADDLRAGRLIALDLDCGVWRDLRHLPTGPPSCRKVRAFIDFIATRFASEPPWDRDFPYFPPMPQLTTRQWNT